MLGPLLDQSGVTGVRLVSLLGTSLVGVGLARSHYDRRVRAGSLERLVLERLRQLRIFGLPDWKDESAKWAAWAAAWPLPRVATGCVPRGTPIRRSRTPPSPTSAGF